MSLRILEPHRDDDRSRVGRRAAVPVAAAPARPHDLPHRIAQAADLTADGLSVDSDGPVVVLQAHHSALPDATPLLALWLADLGMRVLVSGAAYGQGTACAVLSDLGVHPSSSATEVATRWRRRQPAVVTLDAVAPTLVATPGAKPPPIALLGLLDPVRGARSLKVAGATGRSDVSMLGAMAQAGALDLMVVCSRAGSAVAPLDAQPRIDTWLEGLWRIEHSRVARPLQHVEQPLLPRIDDAASNAVWVQSVLSGERPAPPSIERQVDCIVAAMRAMDAATRAV